MRFNPIWKRELVKVLVGMLALLYMNCADKGTEPEEQETSSSLVFSSNHAISFTMNSSNTIHSSSQLMSMSMSSGRNSSSSSEPNPFSAGSSITAISSLRASSSSLSNPISSSSQVVQPLQFLGNQVRIPDGCGVIHWAGEDDYTCVQDFWVDTVEVSIGDYQGLMGGGTPSLYRSGKLLWPSQTGTGYADDGTLCPNCPADAVTIFEAMLYANAVTKLKGNPKDTVYSYTQIDTIDAPGSYGKTKGKEISALQNLVIHEDKLGYRLPNQGEFNYMCMKSNLIYLPWEDLYPDSSVTWLFGTESLSLFESPGYVPPPVGSKKHTSWFLHDLFGSAPEWTTTHPYDSNVKYMALGSTHTTISDFRMDSDRAGFRLVRGIRTERIVPTR